MSPESLTREARNALVREMAELDARLYPEEDDDELPPDQWSMVQERYYSVLGEYADRIPRQELSRCPFCSAPLKRVFDPFGLDGPWWRPSLEFDPDEPAACDHFQVLLGAVNLHGRRPIEVGEEVRPGPDVPFVVPALLALPEMVAVVSEVPLATGDTAYPVAYFSTAEIHPRQLQQPWCRDIVWFDTESGERAWFVANYEFSFDLAPYLESGQLRWTDLREADAPVRTTQDGPCPLEGIEGDRENQSIHDGERTLMGLPSGEPANPFGE